MRAYICVACVVYIYVCVYGECCIYEPFYWHECWSVYYYDFISAFTNNLYHVYYFEIKYFKYDIWTLCNITFSIWFQISAVCLWISASCWSTESRANISYGNKMGEEHYIRRTARISALMVVVSVIWRLLLYRLHWDDRCDTLAIC